MMRVLLLEPGRLPNTLEIKGDLASMQMVVGGLTQAMYPFEEEVALICNEEGKLLGLPPNRALRHPETGEVYDIVVGTFFLCAAPADSENFESLSDEQIRRYTELFRFPEFFLGGTAT